jgi:hypothetical protein
LEVFEKARQKVGDQVAPAQPPEQPPTPPPAVDAPTQVELAPQPGAEPPVDLTQKKPLKLAAPLAAGGVGVAAVIIGGVLGAQAKSAEAAKNNARFESDAVAHAKAAQNMALGANVCFGIAAAAVVTGVVLWLVQN